MRHQKTKGFTLIELMVVLAIILIVTSVSLGYLQGIFKNQPVKMGATVVKMAFGKACQLAVTLRQPVFLFFDVNNSAMIIYNRTIENEKVDLYRLTLDKSKDKPMDGEDPIVLPKGVAFASKDNDVLPAGSLLNREPGSCSPGEELYYLTFCSDGSIKLPAGVFDKSIITPNPPNSADIILKQQKHAGRMYLDYASFTGKIIKMIYWEGDPGWGK